MVWLEPAERLMLQNLIRNVEGKSYTSMAAAVLAKLEAPEWHPTDGRGTCLHFSKSETVLGPIASWVCANPECKVKGVTIT